MITLKFIIFGIIAVVILVLLVKNLNRWAEEFRQYNIKSIKKTIGNNFFVKPLEGWFGTFFSKVWVIFMVLVFIGGVFFVLFGGNL
jgi:hypothetical protein